MLRSTVQESLAFGEIGIGIARFDPTVSLVSTTKDLILLLIRSEGFNAVARVAFEGREHY